MTFYDENTHCRIWFEYAERGLLTNRTIRNFLTGYKTESWPSVVKLTLLYGIASLKSSGVDEPMPLDRLRRAVRQAETARCVEAKLPAIQESMKDLKDDVEEILEAVEERPAAREKIVQTREADARLHEAAAAKGIYPDWWGDGTREEKPVPVVDAKRSGPQTPTTNKHRVVFRESRPVRAPPRLCYSISDRCPRKAEDVAAVNGKGSAGPLAVEMVRSRNDVKRPSMEADFTSALLNDRWMSAFANATDPLVDENYDCSRGSARDGHSIANREVPLRGRAPGMQPPLEIIPSPRSTAFWIDLEDKEAEIKSATTKERPRSGQGYVLDFGHLDSPRFPPKSTPPDPIASDDTSSSIIIDLENLASETSSAENDDDEDDVFSFM